MADFHYVVTRGALALAVGSLSVVAMATPSYEIHDLGVVGSGTGSQGIRISDNGIATGRSLASGANNAFTWTLSGGTVGLPNLTSPNKPYSVGNGVNNYGTVVGVGASTSFGSSPIPVQWTNGVATALQLPSGQTTGNAWDINDHNVAVGSAGSDIYQKGVIYTNGVGTAISATTATGQYFVQAYGINNDGLVAGGGWDPNDASATLGLVYDSKTNTTVSVGSLNAGTYNDTIAFDVSETGLVVGSSYNGSISQAFIWSKTGGIQAIPLTPGAGFASARGVNSAGWVVGNSSTAYSIPFLYDGTQTYRIGDLIPQNSGWDLLTNTSASALSISDNGYIVGTGVLNGKTHAYVLTPVPEPASIFALAGGLALISRRRKTK